MNYCDFCNTLPSNSTNPNKHYHDKVYGFPVDGDNVLFERLVLEINQAGLSWTTVLNKLPMLQTAYSGFDIAAVASYTENSRLRLLADKGIIRNRLKIDAAVYNAQQIILLQQQYGSFANWLDVHCPLPLDGWVKLFKRHFKFVGSEIVGSFLKSTGYLAGAHEEYCPIYRHVLAARPKWVQVQ